MALESRCCYGYFGRVGGYTGERNQNGGMVDCKYYAHSDVMISYFKIA